MFFFCEFLSAVIEGHSFKSLCMFQVEFFFSFIKSRSLKIRSHILAHIPSTVGPGKEALTFTSES